jgi:hypothetical protein
MITKIILQEISLKAADFSCVRLSPRDVSQPLRCSRQTVLKIPSVFSDMEHVHKYRYGLPYKISICVKNAYKGREENYISDDRSNRHGSSTWKLFSHAGKTTETAQVHKNMMERRMFERKRD